MAQGRHNRIPYFCAWLKFSLEHAVLILTLCLSLRFEFNWQIIWPFYPVVGHIPGIVSVSHGHLLTGMWLRDLNPSIRPMFTACLRQKHGRSYGCNQDRDQCLNVKRLWLWTLQNANYAQTSDFDSQDIKNCPNMLCSAAVKTKISKTERNTNIAVGKWIINFFHDE